MEKMNWWVRSIESCLAVIEVSRKLALMRGKTVLTAPQSVKHFHEEHLEASKCAKIRGKKYTGTRKFEHITPVLKKLNWLPVRLILKYKHGILAFKREGPSPRHL